MVSRPNATLWLVCFSNLADCIRHRFAGHLQCRVIRIITSANVLGHGHDDVVGHLPLA